MVCRFSRVKRPMRKGRILCEKVFPTQKPSPVLTGLGLGKYCTSGKERRIPPDHINQIIHCHITLANGDLQIGTARGIKHVSAQRFDGVQFLVGEQTVGFDILSHCLEIICHGFGIYIEDVEQTADTAGHGQHTIDEVAQMTHGDGTPCGGGFGFDDHIGQFDSGQFIAILLCEGMTNVFRGISVQIDILVQMKSYLSRT